MEGDVARQRFVVVVDKDAALSRVFLWGQEGRYLTFWLVVSTPSIVPHFVRFSWLNIIAGNKCERVDKNHT